MRNALVSGGIGGLAHPVLGRLQALLDGVPCPSQLLCGSSLPQSSGTQMVAICIMRGQGSGGRACQLEVERVRQRLCLNSPEGVALCYGVPANSPGKGSTQRYGQTMASLKGYLAGSAEVRPRGRPLAGCQGAQPLPCQGAPPLPTCQGWPGPTRGRGTSFSFWRFGPNLLPILTNVNPKSFPIWVDFRR